MEDANSGLDQHLESLVEITDALLKGEFDHETTTINAEGLLATLTQHINTMIGNMRMVETPLSSAGEQAPDALQHAENIIQLMAQSTGEVLDKSDKVTGYIDKMEEMFDKASGSENEACAKAQELMTAMKSDVFDIIASQSYQDVARQKMEMLITDLSHIRDWLVEALIVLNIKRDDTPETIQKKAQLLKEVKETPQAGPLKQDLVDDLLAEFGF